MSDEDALGVNSNPSTTAQEEQDDEQDRNETGAVRSIRGSGSGRGGAGGGGDDEESILGGVDGVGATAAAPVTPKSFHSTRSSFKKLSITTTTTSTKQQQQQPATHIYDYPSSLNSSRSSSLHHVTNANLISSPTKNITTTTTATAVAASTAPLPATSCNNIIVNIGTASNDVPNVMVACPRSIPMVDLADTNVLVREPIVIRGAGNLTIFGVCNKFSEQFPSALNAKLAPEEFRDTIKQINSILNKELENSFKWLVVGSLFCCCTLGCSLLPVIYLNKKAKLCINKLLDIENQRLYNKLGLRWRLTKLKCNSNSLFEYVLLIEFLPVLSLYQPD